MENQPKRRCPDSAPHPIVVGASCQSKNQHMGISHNHAPRKKGLVSLHVVCQPGLMRTPAASKEAGLHQIMGTCGLLDSCDEAILAK